MARTSDLARDLTDLCIELRQLPGKPDGPTALAGFFNVEPWSAEFMLIMASLNQRIEALRSMINSIELDEDIRESASSCLENIRNAFTAGGLLNQWSHSINTFLSDANVQPIRLTSGYIRERHGYIVPSKDEVDEMIAHAESLREWLVDANLQDRDFIRTALIEGIDSFIFKITRFGHFGWTEVLESLKSVVSAYMALERGMVEGAEPSIYEAAAKKVASFLKLSFEKVKSTKEVYEVSDWVLRGYGALHAIPDAKSVVAGLLQNLT